MGDPRSVYTFVDVNLYTLFNDARKKLMVLWQRYEMCTMVTEIWENKLQLTG